MLNLFSFVVGFAVFAIDLALMVWLITLSIDAAATKNWNRSRAASFIFAVLAKVFLVVIALAAAIVEFGMEPIPLFIGALTSLLIFTFYLLTKKLKVSSSST